MVTLHILMETLHIQGSFVSAEQVLIAINFISLIFLLRRRLFLTVYVIMYGSN